MQLWLHDKPTKYTLNCQYETVKATIYVYDVSENIYG